MPGLFYHVKVSAWNEVGYKYGAHLGSYPAIVPALKGPEKVRDITMSPINSTALKLNWKLSTASGYIPLESYTVEYDYSMSGSDVQEVTISSTSADVKGSFCLSYGGESTKPIPYDALWQSRFYRPSNPCL